MRNDISLDEKVKITKFSTWMDGGTVELECKDQNGKEFHLEISQRMFIERKDFDKSLNAKKPGRIFFDGQCVIPKSRLETQLIECLRKIEFPKSDTQELDKKIIKEAITFIQSYEYLKLFEETNKWN